MSCNGCRILRKGCSENCILRPCIQWLETPEAQANATLFVAKFFGRAGLVSFLSAVPLPHRPALFQSLLYEACGRTVNPVTGAIGLLSSGNWHLCQAAVDAVLNGGSLRPIPQFLAGPPPTFSDGDDVSEVIFPPTINHILPPVQDLNSGINSDNSPPARFTNSKRRRDLTPPEFGQKRPGTPSEESAATISFESQVSPPDMPKLLNLFA